LSVSEIDLLKFLSQQLDEPVLLDEAAALEVKQLEEQRKNFLKPKFIRFIHFWMNGDAYGFRKELDELGGCEESSAVIDALLADALQCLEGMSATLVPRRPAGTGHRIGQLEIPGHSAPALNDVAFDGNSHRRGCLSQTGESY